MIRLAKDIKTMNISLVIPSIKVGPTANNIGENDNAKNINATAEAHSIVSKLP
jgi:hypothetical protein